MDKSPPQRLFGGCFRVDRRTLAQASHSLPMSVRPASSCDALGLLPFGLTATALPALLPCRQVQKAKPKCTNRPATPNTPMIMVDLGGTFSTPFQRRARPLIPCPLRPHSFAWRSFLYVNERSFLGPSLALYVIGIALRVRVQRRR